MASTSKLENHLTKQYFGDGLLDVFVGVGLALIGLSWLFEVIALSAIVPAVMMPLWKPLRQKLMEPRTGFVEFGTKKKRKEKEALAKWLVFGVVLLLTEVSVLFFFDRQTLMGSDLLTTVVPGMPSVLIAIPLAALAFYPGIGRFAFYGFLSIFFGALAMLDIAVEPGHAIFLTGLSITLVGAGVIWRFVEKARKMDSGE